MTFQTIPRDEALQLLLRGLQAKRAEIDAVQRDLRQQLNPPKPEAFGEYLTAKTDQLIKLMEPKPRRKISAAGRRRMAAAQRARWAKVRG